MTTRNNLWPFGIINGRLVECVIIWYNLHAEEESGSPAFERGNKGVSLDI
jgi:hypothetical protein